MKRRVNKGALRDANSLAQLLLYQATGGNMGKAPEKPINKEVATFAEKKALLDTLLKMADLERKADSEVEEESGFSLIKKGLENGGGKSRRKGAFGFPIPESAADESAEGGEADAGEGSSL